MTEQDSQPAVTPEAAQAGNPEEQPPDSGGVVGPPQGGVGEPQESDRFHGKDPDVERGERYGGDFP